MNWKELPKWLKMESVILAVLSLIVLFVGVYQLNYELGMEFFISLFLPIMGGLIAIWIVSYSIFKKSWKFFIYSGGLLAVF
ncbi:hypothetical protein HYS31_07530 [Candidatus Woesearchaeota archaeon]|nr:hypothetical protein [Candidatus Woesearchaeota archaeon]